MALQPKPNDEKKKPFVLPATNDVISLINRIRWKYVKAETALSVSDEGEFKRPGDSQILRAGLIKLDLSLDIDKPKEIMALIDCAEKRRGPQAGADNDDEETHTLRHATT